MSFLQWFNLNASIHVFMLCSYSYQSENLQDVEVIWTQCLCVCTNTIEELKGLKCEVNICEMVNDQLKSGMITYVHQMTYWFLDV